VTGRRFVLVPGAGGDFYRRGTTRKVVASFYLERFPRLMEMVSARLPTMEPRDSG
jgi:hypothetical protein